MAGVSVVLGLIWVWTMANYWDYSRQIASVIYQHVSLAFLREEKRREEGEKKLTGLDLSSAGTRCS